VEKLDEAEGLQRVAASPLSVCPAKSVAFFVDRQPIVVVTLEGLRVHPQALATFCGVKRRAVRLASPAECSSVFGYVPGKN
jgi:prolyl-tRNA editing enzyme YbaK/EbsC (Cys-tRNA(Pro) deacylase)